VLTNSLFPSILHASDKDSKSSPLVYTSADNAKMVPQAISWEQLDLHTKWVVEAPKPSPQITINNFDIFEDRDRATIRFTPRRTPSRLHALIQPSSLPFCLHDLVFN